MFRYSSRVRSSRLELPIGIDRKSTRLNSSHQIISYAVFCLKKKNNIDNFMLTFARDDRFRLKKNSQPQPCIAPRSFALTLPVLAGDPDGSTTSAISIRQRFA